MIIKTIKDNKEDITMIEEITKEVIELITMIEEITKG